MATVVSNAFYTELGGGNNKPHALLFVNNMLWAGLETDPGRFVMIDPANPGVVTTTILPNDGAHKWIVDMCYIPAKGRIYALCGDPFADTAITTVIEINPTTGAYTDVIVDPTYNVQQGSFTFDSTHMFILSRATSNVYVYLLSDWSTVASGVGTAITFGHCIRYDSVSNKLFLTSSGFWGGFALISRMNPATFAVEQAGFWESDKIISDDIAFAGNYVYGGSETTGNIVKFQKDNLANVSRIPMGVTGRNFGVYFDGGVLWTGWEGNAGYFAKVDPATEVVTLYQMPQVGSPGFQGNVNEWVRNGTNLYFTGWAIPGWISQFTVTNFDPATAPTQLLLSDTLVFSDAVLLGDLENPGIRVSDSLNLNDSVGTSRVQANPLADTLVLADAIRVYNNYVLAVSDTLSLLDNSGGVAPSLADSLTLSDSVAVAISLPGLFNVQKLVGDQILFLDVFQIVVPNGFVSITDTLVFSEKVGVVKNSLRNDYLRHYLNDVIEIIPATQFPGSGTDEVFLPQGGSAMVFADAVAVTVT